MLEEHGKPIVLPFEFFRFVRQMRRETPTLDDYNRLRLMLREANVIGTDRDYGRRGVIRVTAVSDLPAEDVICLVDPTYYVSHLSAMQRWGLTGRSPVPTRPSMLPNA